MITGSMTKAAKLLFTSQPTLSRELARVEQILGFPLFDRVSTKLRPTLSALMLFDEVKRSYIGLEQVASVADILRTHKGGQMSIIALPTFTHSLLPGACARFQQLFPRVATSLVAQESPFLEEFLSAQRFDLGLTESATAPAGTTIIPLLEVNEVCILPEGHHLLRKQKIELQDFAGENFVSLSANDPYRMTLDADFAKQGITRNMVAEAPSSVAVCSLVRKGVGVAIVNPLTAFDFEGRRLHVRPLAVSYLFRVSIVKPEHRPRNPMVESFIEELRNEAALILETLSEI